MAGFLGVANLFAATASGRDGPGSCRVRLGEFELEAAGGDAGASGEARVVIRLANGEPLQALVQNRGRPISWQQGTAIAVHLPADALRVLPESA